MPFVWMFAAHNRCNCESGMSGRGMFDGMDASIGLPFDSSKSSFRNRVRSQIYILGWIFWISKPEGDISRVEMRLE